MKDKTDKVLDNLSGIINMVCATVGLGVVIFFRSPEVSTTFMVIGIVAFICMFMYGLNKSVTASTYNV